MMTAGAAASANSGRATSAAMVRSRGWRWPERAAGCGRARDLGLARPTAVPRRGAPRLAARGKHVHI
jgi:hypothetical protein